MKKYKKAEEKSGSKTALTVAHRYNHATEANNTDIRRNTLQLQTTIEHTFAKTQANKKASPPT